MIAAFSSVYPFFFHFVSRKALQLFFALLSLLCVGMLFKNVFNKSARSHFARDLISLLGIFLLGRV